MASQEINIRLSLKDDLSVNLKGVTKTLENVGNVGQAAGNKTETSFKKVLSHAKSFITPFRQVGFILGATLGTAGAAIMNVSQNLDEMDDAASRLGVTTESLSKRLYGFNVATDSVRAGIGQTKGLIQDLQAGMMMMGAGAASLMASASAQIAAWMTPGVTKDQVLEEMASKKVVTQETIKLEVQATEEIKKLSLSERKFKEYQLEQTIEAYRRAGMSEVKIAEYAKIQKIQLEVDKNNEINKNVAARLKVEGNVTEAFRIEQNLQLSNYVKVWGQEGDVMQTFRKLQAAQLRDARITGMGIKQAMDDMANGLEDTFQGVFQDGFNGNLKKASDYFRQFTQSMVNAWAGAMARMAANMVMFGNAQGTGTSVFGGLGNFLGGLFSGGKTGAGAGAAPAKTYHDGGMVRRAHSGLGVGEVPIIAQTGEGILSRRGMTNLANLNRGRGIGGGGVTINITPVIQAWDAADVYRNRKQLTDAVSHDILNNGSLRKVIQQYGR